MDINHAHALFVEAFTGTANQITKAKCEKQMKRVIIRIPIIKGGLEKKDIITSIHSDN